MEDAPGGLLPVDDPAFAAQVFDHAMIARCYNALGELGDARAAHLRGVAVAVRLPGPSTHAQQLIGALEEMRDAVLTEQDESLALGEALLEQDAPELRWVRAVVYATAARGFARAGRIEDALAALRHAVAAMERTPVGDPNLTWVICDAGEALWYMQRTDHIEAIERNVREKVVAPDFRYPMRDGRTALGRLCALQSRYDEATTGSPRPGKCWRKMASVPSAPRRLRRSPHVRPPRSARRQPARPHPPRRRLHPVPRHRYDRLDPPRRRPPRHPHHIVRQARVDPTAQSDRQVQFDYRTAGSHNPLVRCRSTSPEDSSAVCTRFAGAQSRR